MKPGYLIAKNKVKLAGSNLSPTSNQGFSLINSSTNNLIPGSDLGNYAPSMGSAINSNTNSASISYCSHNYGQVRDSVGSRFTDEAKKTTSVNQK